MIPKNQNNILKKASTSTLQSTDLESSLETGSEAGDILLDAGGEVRISTGCNGGLFSKKST